MASDMISVWGCSVTQAEFAKYFDRLRSIEMSFDEIKEKLPQLEKYYQEMVLDLSDDIYQNIYDFFEEWKRNK